MIQRLGVPRKHWLPFACPSGAFPVTLHRAAWSAVLAILLAVTACAPGLPGPPAVAHVTPTATNAVDPAVRIHHASPDAVPLFARITFTSSTTYEQAVGILEREPYPWDCDEPRSFVPPPLAERRAAFSGSHTLLISYPTWEELQRIASSAQVISVDGTPLYPCP